MKRSITVGALIATLAMGLCACTSANPGTVSAANKPSTLGVEEGELDGADWPETDDLGVPEEITHESVAAPADPDPSVLEPIVDALLPDESDLLPPPASEQEIACYNERGIEIAGSDRYVPLKLTVERPKNNEPVSEEPAMSVSEAEAVQFYELYARCGIDARQITLWLLSAAQEISAEGKTCYDAVLTEDVMREMIIDGLTEGPPSEATIASAEAVLECWLIDTEQRYSMFDLLSALDFD